MVMSTNTYDPSEFPAFAVTVDVVVLTMAKGQLQVLLVQRGVDPATRSCASSARTATRTATRG